MTERPWVTQNWWTSPYNHIPEVNSSLVFPKTVTIHDATLRDGEQTPGVVFRSEEKVQIAAMLQEMGVGRIEAGMPAVSEDDAKAIREIARMGGTSKIMGFVRAMESDLDKAAECGCSGVIIEVPISEPKLKYQFGWSWEKVLDVSAKAIRHSKSLGLYTVYFPYDTTRSDPDDLERVLSAIAKEAKPDSVGVVDTVGCALPPAIAYLVRKVKSLVGVPVEVHTHNDFGMAVVNSIYAVSAGAEVVHVCVNGMGERTGNAALDEVAVAFKALCGVDTGIKFGMLKQVSKAVRALSGFPLPPNKPVVGDGNFVRESGIGIEMVMKFPRAMFALEPSFVGSTAGVVLGKKSGLNSVKLMAERMNVDLSDEQARAVLAQVKDLGIAKKSTVSEEEFAKMLQEAKR